MWLELECAYTVYLYSCTVYVMYAELDAQESIFKENDALFIMKLMFLLFLDHKPIVYIWHSYMYTRRCTSMGHLFT